MINSQYPRQTDGFVEKDDENYIRLENCDIGDFRSYMDIFYNETVKAKIIVKNRTSPGDKVFTKKIAGVKYTVIKAPRIRMLRLVTPTKDGKGSIYMNVYCFRCAFCAYRIPLLKRLASSIIIGIVAYMATVRIGFTLKRIANDTIIFMPPIKYSSGQ